MTSSTPFPSGPITSVSGTTVVVRGDDIDTDRIIPARFLKCVTFDALGPAAFADDRAERAGNPAGPHPFDRPEHPIEFVVAQVWIILAEPFHVAFGLSPPLSLVAQHCPVIALSTCIWLDHQKCFHITKQPLGILRIHG